MPPTPPLIYDVHDIQLSSVVGPFHIGDNITLKCRVRGGEILSCTCTYIPCIIILSLPGKPLPRVSWMMDKITMNSSSQVIVRRILMILMMILQVISHNHSTSPSSVQSTINTLHIHNLSRQDDGLVYRCLAFHQALHKPLQQEVTLDVICKNNGRDLFWFHSCC